MRDKMMWIRNTCVISSIFSPWILIQRGMRNRIPPETVWNVSDLDVFAHVTDNTSISRPAERLKYYLWDSDLVATYKETRQLYIY